ncbi:hypothetical protein Lal_00029911 [Lupinus albus]|nr:hypothetical protein Lal_00029911 [Lupinus albus]
MHASENITNTINLIKPLIRESSNDPKAKAYYETCLMHFDDEIVNSAIFDIDYTQKLLKKGDYGGVNLTATIVQTDAEDCIYTESPSDILIMIPPSYHNMLMSTSFLLCQTIMSFLRHEKMMIE